MKCLGVLLDDNVSWNEHIAKNMGLMYRAKPFLDKESLLALYYSCINSYLSYTFIERI